MKAEGTRSGAGGNAGLDSVKMDDEMRSLVMQIAIKCADLSALAADRPVHCEWVNRLEDEFFQQGDKEREAGLPISPLMDRSKDGVTKAQPGVSDIGYLLPTEGLADLSCGFG